ncbi:MAG: nucleoside triphosphate pyrophosphohydrolase [Magnetococcales bacterium]|nr:nucleoside triphosphate pyrophosphohydrolase [Magnetococcales bacterium]
MTDNTTTLETLTRALSDLVARLRAPDGCPWDREQTLNSLLPHTIEEVYEVVSSVENQDYTELKNELGDLTFHVFLYSQIAQEAGLFSLEEVIQGVTAKMIHRHPHVFKESGEAFTDEQGRYDSKAHTKRWEDLKRQEKEKKAHKGPSSVFDGLSNKAPALLWAFKVQQKMAKVGFDWDEIPAVTEKVREELNELSQAQANEDRDNIEEEIGDVLFTMTNLARHLKVNPETALRRSTLKFQNRFRYIEEKIHADGQTIYETERDAMEVLWQESKKHRDT